MYKKLKKIIHLITKITQNDFLFSGKLFHTFYHTLKPLENLSNLLFRSYIRTKLKKNIKFTTFYYKNRPSHAPISKRLLSYDSTHAITSYKYPSGCTSIWNNDFICLQVFFFLIFAFRTRWTEEKLKVL
jgi:hypothetical protein